MKRKSRIEGGLYGLVDGRSAAGLVCVVPGLWGYCHHD